MNIVTLTISFENAKYLLCPPNMQTSKTSRGERNISWRGIDTTPDRSHMPLPTIQKTEM